MSTSIRNYPLSHERAPSHRKPAMPRASEIAARLAAGETLDDIARQCQRSVTVLRQDLSDRGYDSATALPRVETPARPTLSLRDAHMPYALRYKAGTTQARQTPRAPVGRFKTREQAEAVRDHCQHADAIEVYDVRTP